MKPVMSISSNMDDLKKLLSLAITQTEQLQKTLKEINDFELISNLDDGRSNQRQPLPASPAN